MPVTQRKRSFQLFRKLKFSSGVNTNNSTTNINNQSSGDEGNYLEIDKMILHVLDCLGALQCVMGQYDSARAKVFWGAVATIAEIGIDQATGHVDRRHPGASHLLRAFPNELKATDGRGWLPLHWAAVTDNVEVNDIRSIARADPLATVKGFNQPISATPGHLIAAVRHPRMEVVRCLYNFYPRMANAKDNEGDLPLHYAARYSESTDMINFLLQANPSATKVKGEGNLVPLQHALYHEHPVYKQAIVRCLLEADPSAASVINADGDTVFHIAIHQECSQELLRMLAEVFPAGLRIQNDIGHLPLHTACLSNDMPRSCENIALLLEAYPEAVRVPCAYGHLPAHIAAESSNSCAMEQLFGVYPEAAFHCAVEDNGHTPLMKAVLMGNVETMNYLCDHIPACVSLVNTQGMTAMHCAAELGDNLIILKRLAVIYPEASKVPDREGRLPLHVFLQAHPEVLLSSHHNDYFHHPVATNNNNNNHTINTTNIKNNGHYLHHDVALTPTTPAVFAKGMSNEIACLRYLLGLNPDAVQAADNRGVSPLSLLFPPMQQQSQNTCPLVQRMVLQHHCPPELKRLLQELNYQARKWALFLTEAAINADGDPNIFAKLRGKDHYLLKEIFSFL